MLQQVTVQRDQVPVTYTYFDTEPEGKFALGLVYGPGGMRAAAGPAVVSHFSPVVWDAAAVSAYWERLGFPAFPMQHAAPRADSRYRDKPLSLAFEVGYQRHTQFRYEWISPPPSPANIYADFLNKHHREGIQHIGMPVEDLAKSVAAYEKLGYHVHQSGAWGMWGSRGRGSMPIWIRTRPADISAGAPQLLIMWGRLVTCGGLVIRLVLCKKIVRPIANRPQVTNLPHKNRMLSEHRLIDRDSPTWALRQIQIAFFVHLRSALHHGEPVRVGGDWRIVQNFDPRRVRPRRNTV